MPQTESMAISEGPVQPIMSPEEVTIELVVRVLSSMGSLETPISFREGREKALVVPSPKTPTRAKRSWNSVTAAESQRVVSHDLWAPFAVAGLKILHSVCETEQD